MRWPHDAVARSALGAYRLAPPGDRFHTWVRWLTCPIPEVERQVPRSGRVLDVGCGHGLVSLYLALASPSRSVVGVDIDAHKVELGCRAASSLPEEARPELLVGGGDLPVGPFDAVVVNDVLYLLGPEGRSAMLAACARRLAPGGVLVIKETDVSPRWKAALAELQEVVSTRVIGITQGEQLDFASSAQIAAELVGLGLSTTVTRVDQGYVHPHVIVTGRAAR